VEKRPARDPGLLDALEEKSVERFDGDVWRVAHETRNPLDPSSAGGRWDRGVFDVLYTSLERDGAIAEVDFHIRMQPVFPSKYKPVLHRLHLVAVRAIRFSSIRELEPLGVDPTRYRETAYERTQEIGDAAAFLGLGALIVPNARWPALNAVVIVDVDPDPPTVELLESEPVDLPQWRTVHRRKLLDR
jgi:RES domain-containing protein